MSATALPRFPFPECSGVQPPPDYALLGRSGEPADALLSNGYQASLVAGYEAVKTVLSDDRFSRAGFHGKPMFARSPESLALVTSDPPGHTRRRRAVMPAFTARRVRGLTPWLDRLARSILADMAARRSPADLVGAFTVPFTMRVIGELIGIPSGDHARLRPLVDMMMSTTRFTPARTAAAHEEAHRYFSALVARREAAIASRGGPHAPDLLTALLTRPGCERLSREETVVMCAGLLMAGYETTSNQLAMCAFMLFGDPGLVRLIRAKPSAMTTVVEEMLRWSSLIAIGGVPHVATEDVPLGRTVIRAGQVVVPLTDAADLDESVFADAGLFIPERAANPHLAFGYGRHYCLGAHLARAELRAGLTAMLSTFADLRLAVPPEQVRWRRGMFIRGPEELPVRWILCRRRRPPHRRKGTGRPASNSASSLYWISSLSGQGSSATLPVVARASSSVSALGPCARS
jgi:cytochrome P450